MRTNPQPASGPVSIKHVRNTVPKKPLNPTAPAVSVPAQKRAGPFLTGFLSATF